MNQKESSLAKLSKALDTQKGRRIVMAVTAVVALLVLWKGVKPAMDGAKSARSEAAQVTETNQTTEREIATLTPKLANQKANDISGALNTALPPKAVADKQLATLNSLANQTRVDIPTFEPGEPDGQGSSYQFVPVNLSIKGSLENCLRFLGGLNSMVKVKGDSVDAYGPIWQINQLSLAPGQGDEISLSLAAGYYIAGAGKPAEQSTPPEEGAAP